MKTCRMRGWSSSQVRVETLLWEDSAGGKDLGITGPSSSTQMTVAPPGGQV